MFPHSHPISNGICSLWFVMFVMFVICITMIWPAWYDHLTMTGLVSGAEVSLASVASEMHAQQG